jgi:peptide/nickel transport system permease protein
MIRYILRRLLQMIPTVLGVIVITFILFHVVGGSPAKVALGKNASPRALEEFDAQRGLDKPLFFGRWTTTHAWPDMTFETAAGPFQRVPAAAHSPRADRKPGFIRLPPGGRHPLPLAFSLRPDAVYRLEVTYRLPSGRARVVQAGAAAAEPAAETAQPAPVAAAVAGELPPSREWQTARLAFRTDAAPDSRLLAFAIEGADSLDLRAVRLRRQTRHLFDSQFVFYLGRLARLDFGESLQARQRVSAMLRAGILPSLSLTVPIFLGGLLAAVAVSLVCAFFRDTRLDRAIVVVSVALMCVNYIAWIVFGQYLLAFRAGWFPVWGYQSWAYLALPVLIGIVSSLGGEVRFYRTIMLDEMYRDYVRTAFAKGVGKPRVLFVHVLKNAMIPILTNVVVAIPFLYTGSLLLESFFGIPGLGSMGINAINSSDFDVLKAVILVGSVLYVLANLLTDITYALFDPRVKLA